jgi:hypothetical protein
VEVTGVDEVEVTGGVRLQDALCSTYGRPLHHHR